jgi:transcriptional regulator with XRE-family HTH domain
MSLNGTDIVKRIDDLLMAKGEKRQILADALDFSVANIAKWKKRRTLPSSDNAVAIAGYFAVSVDWLLTGEDKLDITREERNLLVKYQSLDDQGQYEVMALLDAKMFVRKEEDANLPHSKSSMG